MGVVSFNRSAGIKAAVPKRLLAAIARRVKAA
jgi:hypothetical protein